MSWASDRWRVFRNHSAQIGAAVGTVVSAIPAIGPVAGAAIAAGGALLQRKPGGGDTVPQISSPSNPVPTTPGFMGGNLGGQGVVNFAPTLNGEKITGGNEVYGNPPVYRGGSDNNSAMPILFGLGAIMLLSD